MNKILFDIYCRNRKILQDFESSRSDNKSQEILDYVNYCRQSNADIEKNFPELVEVYLNNQKIISSFSIEQKNFICSQIGDWYLSVKFLFKGSHNLGYQKEVLKTMICGDE